MSYADDYYTILGVDRRATAVDIEAAFAVLQTEWIVSGRDVNNDPVIERLRYAHEVLSDPQRRALYDSLLADALPPALALEVQCSSAQLAILDTPQLIYLLMTLRPPDANHKPLLPLNLCLVVDRSTSMRGERLGQVITAVQMVLDKLAPSDVISVISFSDRAEVLLPARRLAAQQKPRDAISAMQASGGTEIFQGLAAGVQQMRQVDLAAYTNHLVLLTDGHTYGDADKCLRLAAEMAAAGITITAFGLGDEWNDDFLDALVAPSNGQSDYIAAPDEIIRHLETRIKGMGAIYARNVRLAQKWPGRITLQDGFKLTPFAQPLDLTATEIPLGDIEGRAALTCLLELSIAPQPIATRIKLPLTITAVLTEQTDQTQTLREEVKLLVMADPPVAEPPPALVEAVRLLNMYRLNEKVWDDVAAGELSTAATRLRYLTTRFLEAGEPALARQASVEAQRLAHLQTLSPEGRKRLKYGTRALLSRALPPESNDAL